MANIIKRGKSVIAGTAFIKRRVFFTVGYLSQNFFTLIKRSPVIVRSTFRALEMSSSVGPLDTIFSPIRGITC